MNYTIINLTDSTRSSNPNHMDLLQYTYDNSTVVKKHFIVEEDISEVTIAREWRDAELQATDFIVPLTDYPNHALWLTYRQELRDWTSTDTFPDTKPIKP